MIKQTKVGTLLATGEDVWQVDAGHKRMFKTTAGKEVMEKDIDFITGPVTPPTKDDVVGVSQASDEDIAEVLDLHNEMEELNEKW